MGLIIVGFSGVGKTYLAKNCKKFTKHSIIEIDESAYHYYVSGLINPSFPANYVTAINQAKLQYDIVILPYSRATISSLTAAITDDFVIVYPVAISKDFYEKRYRSYITNENKLRYYLSNFDSDIKCIENTLAYHKYRLTPKQYISSCIDTIYNKFANGGGKNAK